jgi:hypothetical protein
MTLTIDVKDDGVLTLLRDMERLDLLHVATLEAVSPDPGHITKKQVYFTVERRLYNARNRKRSQYDIVA